MIVTTTNEIAGKQISDYLGIAHGVVVRTPTIGEGFTGGLKSIIGGKNGGYSQTCARTREDAYEEMVSHAKRLGANAVIAFRYDTSNATENSTEVIAYGTAVRLA